MGKAVRTALTAAFIVLGGALAVGATFSGVAAGGTLLLTAGGALTAAGMAVFTFTTTLLGSLIGGMTSKGINASAGNFGSKFATRAPLAPRQIIYGECRVGGTVVHIETTGTDNYLLHMVVAIAGHEIESLETLRLNDINTTTTTSTINGSTVYTVTNADFTNTENDNNFGSGRLVRYSFEDGSQTAVNGYMNAQLASMGTTDKFLGVAYVYIQMVFDAEKFGGGQPAISFKVKGKNVYDPRTGANATTDLQRSNPALIIRDYLTDTQYGLKANASEINDTTNAGGIASAANTCDQQVTLADGSTQERRYTANGFTNFSANGNGVLEALLSSMAGKMSYVNGQFTVFAGASQTPSLTITDDELLAPIALSTNTTSNDLYNSIKPVYIDASLNFISTDAEVYQDSTFLNADTPSGESTVNYVKQMETQLPFTVTDTMAQRLGRIALKSQRQTTSLSVLVSLQFMRCQPSDWVYLTNERLGFNQKVFEVLATNMEVIQDGDVPVLATRLQLKEVEAAVFNFATNDYTTGQAEGSNVSTGDYSVTAPTNLSLAQQNAIDGTTSKVDILVSWTNNASDKVTLTEITYKLSTDSNYTSDFTAGKGVAKASIPNVVVGSTYNVKIRHIDVNGVASPYTSVVNITISAASSAPATPSNLSASSNKQNILVSWTNPNNSDLRAVKIYRRTANTTPTDDTYLVDTLAGEPNAVTTTIFGDQDGLTAGTTYYFWVRAINHSDQHSAFSSSVNGTFTAAVIGDGTITELKLADDAVTNAKIAVDAIQGDVIAAGAIVENKLATNAITADKISANAVTAVKITAGAVVAGKLAADSIVANNIQADAVTATKIQANAVNADKINVSNLAAISANMGSITAGSIDIGSGTFTVATNGAMTATSATITGAVTSTSGTIGGYTLSSNSLIAGSGASRISLSTADGIHLGNNTFSSAPFRVALDGSLTATNATVTGTLTLTNVDGTTMTYGGGNLQVGTIGSGNLGSSAIFPATLRYERSNSTAAPSNSEFSTAFGRNPKNNDIVVVARTDTGAQVAYKHDGSSFSVVSNYIDGDLIVDGTISTDQIEANAVTSTKINTTNLFLPSFGGEKTGTTLGYWNANDLNYRHVAEIGSGSGFYTGYVRVFKGSFAGQIKTISFLISDGTFGPSSSNDVNTSVTFTDITKITEASSHAIFVTTDLQYLSGGWIADSRLTTGKDSSNIPLSFRYTGSGTLNIFIYAQGDSNTQYMGGADARFVHFST